MSIEPASSESLPRRAERTYAVVALLLAVSLHTLFLMGSGALWRDEVNSVNLARADSFGEISANLEFDSFPIGWFVVLRPFASFFGPEEAFAYRGFGVVIGLLLMAAVTIAGIDMTGRPPILSINLLLLSATVIRFGDSTRGYGLGMLFASLTYWAVWRFAEHRTRASAVAATLVATASVHFIYYNAIIVFATCIAAAVSCWLRGARRAAAGAIAIGAVAAVTLVPYLSVFRRARTWNDFVRFDIGLEWIHRMSAWSITHSSGKISLLLWYAALAFGFAVAGALALRAARRLTIEPRVAYHAAALSIGFAAYLTFLLRLGYWMAPWYFLAFMVLAAMAADALLGAIARNTVRFAVVLVLAAHLALSFGPVSRYVSKPATNLPGIAELIANEAGPDDLVLVSPWECGVAWKIYYAGSARWSTVPPIEFLTWHRYDLFYQAHFVEDRNASLLELVDATLASGGRVFIVTRLHYEEPPGRQPHSLLEIEPMAKRFIAHFNSTGHRISVYWDEDNANSYERCSVLEVVPNATSR